MAQNFLKAQEEKEGKFLCWRNTHRETFLDATASLDLALTVSNGCQILYSMYQFQIRIVSHFYIRIVSHYYIIQFYYYLNLRGENM